MHPNRTVPTSTNTVNTSLTGNRRFRPVVENDQYTAFARRILRAAGRRVADGDVEALPGLLDLADELDTAIGHAVTGLRAYGYSWAEIALRIGCTRQAAHQRWGGDSA